MRRRGFTLLELVVVIALLTLLSALLVMAIGKMQISGKRQQTRLIMQNLSAMFADFDVNRRVPFGAGSLSPNLVTANNLDVTYLPMAAPGDVANGPDRTSSGGNFAVCFTRDFMAQLMSTPNNAASIGKLPSSSLMTFVGQSYPNTISWKYTTAYRMFVSAYSNSTQYIRTSLYVDPAGTGAVLQDGQVSFAAAPSPSFTTNAPPNYFYWMPDLYVLKGSTTPLPTPVVLDAWGNPIIFVMGGVLGNLPTSGIGTVTVGTTKLQIHSPDYHPFFASAGPDGDFSKGDDNLYSFEK